MATRLSSVQMDSFITLARELNFSRAADLLHVSQPALTKRIQSLEDTLGQNLFLRLRSGVQLTEAGRILYRHTIAMEQQEQEMLDDLIGGKGGFSGSFRLASFSSCLRSILIPAISPLLRDNPRLSCQFLKEEAGALQELLVDGKVDYSVSLSECDRMGIENICLGTERNVLIESSIHHGRNDCYIDHDPHDTFTERFFLVQTGATVPKMLRAYFDDIYGLIDAVEQGVGRAVVPLHLLRPEHRVRQVQGFRPYDVPVFLHFFRRDHYTKLQRAVIDTLVREAGNLYCLHQGKVADADGVAGDALVLAQRRVQRQISNAKPLRIHAMGG